MKVGIIIPHRGDRPEFMAHLLKMIKAQQFNGEIMAAEIDYTPINDDCDITARYRRGYEFLSGMGFDVLAFMEVDDYYAPNYLQTMVDGWLAAGKPDLFGIDYSINYHLGLRRWFKMPMGISSAAMCTLIKPNLHFTWCADNVAYTDVHLWAVLAHREKVLSSARFSPETPICMGIKHGIGKVGGAYHNTRHREFVNDDAHLHYLQQVTGADFPFYQNMSNKIREVQPCAK